MDTSTDSAIDLEIISTKEEAKKINPINKDTVHRICSGQVVLSLAIAVKELVENSLDSGATNIEVRLKEYGEELIEVIDNGSGVTEDNFSGLTLKYHTSKLRDFSDLLSVTTFGFRGEALSSLCALADMTIVTRHSSVDIGTKLVYDHKGILVSQIPCARQQGTTVSLSNLFKTLPVRQKEFHKNAKREFNKMTQMLYAYCLVSERVKIVCTHQVNKGQKSVVVATQGGSVKDNIACVFGVKQSQSLLDLSPVYPESYVENIKETFFNNLEHTQTQECSAIHDGDKDQLMDVSGIKSDIELELSEDSNDVGEVTKSQSQGNGSSDNVSDTFDTPQSSQLSINKIQKKPFDFEGYISSCAHGAGRTSKDRQFFYVNSRPCEPNKIMKLVNEIYKSYNVHQVPFIYLNLKMKRCSVDVNVTPDKRKLFFDREKHLMDVIKASLNKVYENIPSSLKLENVNSGFIKMNDENGVTNLNAPRIFTSFLSQFSSNKFEANESSKKTSNKSTNDCKRKATSCIDNYISKISRLPDESQSVDQFKEESLGGEDVSLDILNDSKEITHSLVDIQCEMKDNLTDNAETVYQDNLIHKTDENIKDTVFLGFSDNIPYSQVVNITEVIGENDKLSTSPEKKKFKMETSCKKRQVSVVVDSDFEKDNAHRNTIKINVTLDEIKVQMFDNYRINNETADDLKKVKFRNKINPVYNKECEEELKKEISKEMFSQMSVVGQFNLGFIITRLQNDLFIIDQHATDEKYNFETLQKTTVLTNQKLVIPQNLELSGVNERILMDSLEVFRFNGFTFQIDEFAPPTKRVKLVTVPVSKGLVFGKEDIDELLFMLQDSPNELCRPSRVRSMFASRACRKSVMIGMALSRKDMRRLVDHMGTLEQPWNCPHGRPTIRHLINMALIQTSN